MAANRNGATNTQGKRPMSAKAKAKKKRNRIILFVVEIFVLLITLVILYGVLKTTDGIQKVVINEEEIKSKINEKVEDNVKMKGYRNIALFGVDARNGALGKGTRTDTIMIASINEDTKEVKLVSVYRDTFLNLGNDSYNKCNAAYAKGGPEQAINMLNMNLDLDITDFVTVGFSGLVETIDALGGVMIDVDSAEIDHLNNYQLCMAEDLNRSYKAVSETGYQLLDGMQATAYCRIRYTARGDFERTERQREVLMAVAEKAKKANVATLNNIADKVFPQVATSLDLDEILSLLGDVAQYSIVDNAGFPFADKLATGKVGGKGSCIVPINLEKNVQALHDFLFADPSYTVSPNVQSYSKAIVNETSKYIKAGNTDLEEE